MGGDNGGDADLLIGGDDPSSTSTSSSSEKPQAVMNTSSTGSMTVEEEKSSTRSMVLLVMGSLLLAVFLMIQMTSGEHALAAAAADGVGGGGALGGAPKVVDGVSAEAQVEAAEAQTVALDAMESGVGDVDLTAKAAVEGAGIDALAMGDGRVAAAGAGVGVGAVTDTGRSDADVLPDGFGVDATEAGAASGAAGGGSLNGGGGGTTAAAIGGGVVELDTVAAASKADLNGGLPDASTIQPVGAAQADVNERAATAAATGGDAFAFGAAAAAGPGGGGAGPGTTTEEAFEKEAKIRVDPATAFEDIVQMVRIDEQRLGMNELYLRAKMIWTRRDMRGGGASSVAGGDGGTLANIIRYSPVSPRPRKTT